jgi:CubicO group peptidase (beta-lactamase class C family)
MAMRIRSFVLAILAAVVLSPLAAAQDQRPATTWPAATPESVGLDPKVLAEIDADIAGGKYGYIDSMLIIRHGKLVYDRSYKHDYDRIYGKPAREPGALNAHDPSGPYNYFNPWWHPFYRRGDLHSMQSVTKTVTSVVIGVASARGEFPSLDTPILKFFDRAKVANVDERKRRVTIRNLLTMTGGFDWNEDLPYNDPKNSASLMEASADWVQFTIDRPMAREPGSQFNYSSGESELLAHIFRVATGRDIEEYAAGSLFAPLGITEYYWKRTPSGLADTEGGLYLRSHDLAKIAYLFLKNGVWQGRQIVTADWVNSSVTPAVSVGRAGVKYGYKWWLYPYGEGNVKLAWAGSGFGGQMPIIVPDEDLVMVFTGWNILDGKRFGHREALDRVLRAIRK